MGDGAAGRLMYNCDMGASCLKVGLGLEAGRCAQGSTTWASHPVGGGEREWWANMHAVVLPLLVTGLSQALA